MGTGGDEDAQSTYQYGNNLSDLHRILRIVKMQKPSRQSLNCRHDDNHEARHVTTTHVSQLASRCVISLPFPSKLPQFLPIKTLQDVASVNPSKPKLAQTIFAPKSTAPPAPPFLQHLIGSRIFRIPRIALHRGADSGRHQSERGWHRAEMADCEVIFVVAVIEQGEMGNRISHWD